MMPTCGTKSAPPTRGDERGDDEDEQLEVGGGVAAEEHAVLAVADGLLHEAEFGAVQPAADEADEQQQRRRWR